MQRVIEAFPEALDSWRKQWMGGWEEQVGWLGRTLLKKCSYWYGGLGWYMCGSCC